MVWNVFVVLLGWMSASSHLFPYTVLKMTLLCLSVNYLLGETGLLASEIQFYQIMFHCIQGLHYIILYLCLKCRCMMVLMWMTPLINLLIKWMFWYIRKPWLGHYCIQYHMSNAYGCITNTWILYFCDEVCNVRVTFGWDGSIFLRQLKFFHFLRMATYLLLVAFLHDANMTVAGGWESLCVLMYFSPSEKPLVSVVGIGGVSGFFSVV